MGADPNSARHFDAAIAVLRVFFGFVFLTNGAAKLVPGPWSTPLGYLFDSSTALAVAREAAAAHPVAPYREALQSVILPNWPAFVAFLGVFEVVLGTLLVLGLATRLAALAGAGFGLHLQFMALSAGHWMFQHALVWLPLLVLAVIHTSRFGLDGLLRARSLVGRDRNNGR